MKGLNVVALIPARGGSKGIPKKNIIDFCGYPLICWSIKQALGSECGQNVYVSSDDEDILRISESYGAKAILRPKALASDASPSEDALRHAIEYIEKVDGKRIDLAVYIQTTSPLRMSADINAAIKLFLREKADSLFSGSILADLCVWNERGGRLQSLTYDYNNRGRRQERKPYYLENGSIYIFKPEILRRRKNRLGGKIAFYPMPFWKSYEIDSAEDIELCEYYMKKHIIKNKEREKWPEQSI